jgi:hypothetical protein
MTDDDLDALIRRTIGGDTASVAAVLARGTSSTDPRVTALAGVLARRSDLVDRAGSMAITSRDRQLVAICRAHLDGDRNQVDALARDHLADHPGSLIVAWIADGAVER